MLDSEDREALLARKSEEGAGAGDSRESSLATKVCQKINLLQVHPDPDTPSLLISVYPRAKLLAPQLSAHVAFPYVISVSSFQNTNKSEKVSLYLERICQPFSPEDKASETCPH